MDLILCAYVTAVFLAGYASSEPPCLENQQKSHHFDRHKYYVCYFGKWVMKPCFYGWEYDIRTEKCQEPYRAPGGSRPKQLESEWVAVPGEGPMGSVVSRYSNAGFTNSKNSFGSAKTSCECTCGPPTPCYHGHYYADNCNCRKFYHCDHGGAHHKDCGPGTAFNPLLNVCDWPFKVPLCRYLGQL